MKPWGRQNVKCQRCKNPSVMTYETAEDLEQSNSHCIRYFESMCASCLAWSAFVLVNNGQLKLAIGHK